jgi:hypothetical protein
MGTLERLLRGLLEDPGDEGRYLVLADCPPPTGYFGFAVYPSSTSAAQVQSIQPLTDW